MLSVLIFVLFLVPPADHPECCYQCCCFAWAHVWRERSLFITLLPLPPNAAALWDWETQHQRHKAGRGQPRDADGEMEHLRDSELYLGLWWLQATRYFDRGDIQKASWVKKSEGSFRVRCKKAVGVDCFGIAVSFLRKCVTECLRRVLCKQTLKWSEK